MSRQVILVSPAQAGTLVLSLVTSLGAYIHRSLQLIAHDLPPKSRVETQVKVRLEFANMPVASAGAAATAGGTTHWRWLRLPFTASVKQPRFYDHGMCTTFNTCSLCLMPLEETIASESLLHLHASAICASEPHLPASCCSVCYAREAKRRPKYYPQPADTDSPTSVIDFTCEPIIDLSSGSVHLSFSACCSVHQES
jgi:hypothetical protein